MRTNLVLQKESALSENVKVSSLSQEVVRVLLNCSEDIEDSSRMEHLEHLCTKMKTSGYNTPYIRKLLVNGIKSYERKLLRSKLNKSDNNYTPLHLSKMYNAKQRRENKLLAKTNWFRSKEQPTEETSKEQDGGVHRAGRNSSNEHQNRNASNRKEKSVTGWC